MKSSDSTIYLSSAEREPHRPKSCSCGSERARSAGRSTGTGGEVSMEGEGYGGHVGIPRISERHQFLSFVSFLFVLVLSSFLCSRGEGLGD